MWFVHCTIRDANVSSSFSFMFLLLSCLSFLAFDVVSRSRVHFEKARTLLNARAWRGQGSDDVSALVQSWFSV